MVIVLISFLLDHRTLSEFLPMHCQSNVRVSFQKFPRCSAMCRVPRSQYSNYSNNSINIKSAKWLWVWITQKHNLATSKTSHVFGNAIDFNSYMISILIRTQLRDINYLLYEEFIIYGRYFGCEICCVCKHM